MQVKNLLKVKNLKPKCFLIPVSGEDSFRLLPGGAVQSLPSGCDSKYINSLVSCGYIEIVESSKKAAKNEDDDSGGEDKEVVINALRSKYIELAGEAADRRWGEDKLLARIEELEASQDEEE